MIFLSISECPCGTPTGPGSLFMNMLADRRGFRVKGLQLRVVKGGTINHSSSIEILPCL